MNVQATWATNEAKQLLDRSPSEIIMEIFEQHNCENEFVNFCYDQTGDTDTDLVDNYIDDCDSREVMEAIFALHEAQGQLPSETEIANELGWDEHDDCCTMIDEHYADRREKLVAEVEEYGISNGLWAAAPQPPTEYEIYAQPLVDAAPEFKMLFTDEQIIKFGKCIADENGIESLAKIRAVSKGVA